MLDNLSAGRKILAVFALFAAILLAGGAAVTLSFLRVTHNGLEVGEHLAPLGDAAMEIKLNAAFAHLKLEEIIAGDTGGDFSAVEDLIGEAGFYIDAILNGGRNDEGTFQPSRSPAVRQYVSDLEDGRAALLGAARARFDLMRSDQGVGSEADARFDAVYEGLIEGIGALAATRPESARVQRLAGEARFRLAHGHLLFEEVQSGDTSEDIAESTSSFDAAKEALRAAAPELGAGTGDLIAEIDTLAGLAQERYAKAQARLRAIEETRAAFSRSYQAFIRSADEAEELVHLDMAAGIARLHDSAQIARVSLAVAGLFLLAAVLLAYRGLDRSFGLRLRQLSACMRRLLCGDLAAEAPAWRSTDEVGVLRDSIEDMRAAFLRQVELEKTAETSRLAAQTQAENASRQAQLAEEGRAEAFERQKAAQQRAEIAAHFAEAFGTLVRSATAGRFDTRMATDFGDAAFNELAGGMNRVMGEVERGLGETGQVLAAMARGDLSTRMGGAYEGAFATLKANTNKTIEKVSETVNAIDSAARDIVAGTDEIAESSGKIAQRTAAQATAVNETASTTDALSSQVSANSESARRVAAQAKLASDRAELGGDALKRTVTAIQQIDDSAQKVKNIIGVIDDISFQTNLLALNAGVEAARAGEAGKGFAVVAQEVRQLAQRATEAAHDIGKLIEESLRDVADGVRLVNETGDELTEVLKAIGSVAETTQEITSANEEQNAGVTSINRKIADIGRMTQQNASVAESSAEAARRLNDQAHRLGDLLAFFSMGREMRATPNPLAGAAA